MQKIELLSEMVGCSVAQLCPILCDPMNRSMPVFPVLHHLLECPQTRGHKKRKGPCGKPLLCLRHLHQKGRGELTMSEIDGPKGKKR